MHSDFQNAINKLDTFDNRYEELNEKLSDMEVIKDQNLFKKLSKELSQIEETVMVYRNFKNLVKEYDDSKVLLDEETDPEMKAMAKEEIESLTAEIEILKGRLKVLLIPPDPLADKNIIVEIRAGTGGDEATLFAAELYRMYTKYAEKKSWKVEILDSNETELGGFKEIVFSISGSKVYENLRFESGAHRVQRVPATESGGRVHTSAVTVAVLPEAEEADIEIRNEDLKIETARSGGAGGQHVNKTESKVVITHIPTGLVVKCEDNRSQHQNRMAAMKLLRSRLYEQEVARLEAERANSRKSQVGSGDRSEKIRTYNFPQNRVTDHRINLTLYKLEIYMMGEMDEVLEALKINMQQEQLKETS